MELNIDEFLKFMAVHDYSFTKVSKLMGIHRSHLWKVIKGKQSPGNKFLNGFKMAFPDEQSNNFFLI